MSDNVPEVTPEKVPDDIALWLVVTTFGEQDGQGFATCHQSEQDARQFLGGDNYSRFAGVVKVSVPRALLKERWKEPNA